MSKFRFIGNPRDKSDGKTEITHSGINFPLNEAVEVDDEKVAGKLRGNTHFQEISTRNRTPKEEAADARATKVPVLAKGVDNAVNAGAGESHFSTNEEVEAAEAKAKTAKK